MNKEKWLQKEIVGWEQESLISKEIAETLKERYTPKKNVNLLVAIFSVVSSLLIGAGIILILAKNWYALPLFLRIFFAFLPLVLSQALAVFVVKRKQDSIAWRESAAILVTASVFAAIAIVGQVFHISGDSSTYILTCGVLILPMIHILDAAAPLIVYYWSLLNFEALGNDEMTAVILVGLFLAGAIFVFLKRKQEGARVSYMTWLTLIAGFVVLIIAGDMLDSSVLLIVLAYFTLLLAAEGLSDSVQVPCNVIGLLGTLTTVILLTYEDMWEYMTYSISMNLVCALFTGGIIAVALFFVARTYKRDFSRFLFLLLLVLVGVMRYSWMLLKLDYGPFPLIYMGAINLIVLFIGIGFMVYGVKNMSLLSTNVGMVTVCILIIMRFFDSALDFLWRGIVFLVLGIALLLVNRRILREKRIRDEEVVQ